MVKYFVVLKHLSRGKHRYRRMDLQKHTVQTLTEARKQYFLCSTSEIIPVLILDDVWKFLSQSEGNTSNQSSFGVDCAALARSRVVELVGRRLGPRKCFVTTKYFIIGT